MTCCSNHSRLCCAGGVQGGVGAGAVGGGDPGPGGRHTEAHQSTHSQSHVRTSSIIDSVYSSSIFAKFVLCVYLYTL